MNELLPRTRGRYIGLQYVKIGPQFRRKAGIGSRQWHAHEFLVNTAVVRDAVVSAHDDETHVGLGG